MSSGAKYFCPFCLSSWYCPGPHIQEQDMDKFNEYIWYLKEDLALLAGEAIRDFAQKQGIDIGDLEESIYNIIMNRSY